MNDFMEQKAVLITEIEKLYERYQLHKTVGEDYFEPGMMEFLDKSYGYYDGESGEIEIQFEVKGTRYDGRI